MGEMTPPRSLWTTGEMAANCLDNGGNHIGIVWTMGEMGDDTNSVSRFW
jgi:hypothetical protein